MFPESYSRAYIVDVLSGLGTLQSVVHYIVNLDTITETHHRYHFPPTALKGLPSLCSRLSSLACLQRGRERLPWGQKTPQQRWTASFPKYKSSRKEWKKQFLRDFFFLSKMWIPVPCYLRFGFQFQIEGKQHRIYTLRSGRLGFTPWRCGSSTPLCVIGFRSKK